jgi:hypothetical protein
MNPNLNTSRTKTNNTIATSDAPFVAEINHTILSYVNLRIVAFRFTFGRPRQCVALHICHTSSVRCVITTLTPARMRLLHASFRIGLTENGNDDNNKSVRRTWAVGALFTGRDVFTSIAYIFTYMPPSLIEELGL